MKRRLGIVGFVCLLLWLSFSVPAVAEDNAESGENASQQAVAGFYRSRDWLYKVSIYIGKADTASVRGSISDFYLVGQPIFLAPSSLKPASGYNIFCSPYNKIQYQQGQKLKVEKMRVETISYFPDVPAIPIINKGSITAVKQYFGDTKSLLYILDNIARGQGTTKEALLTAKSYTVRGETKRLPAERLLPVKNAAGVYQNALPFLIVYEPIAIGYLRDKKTALAFTATEYAISQKLGETGNGLNFFNRKLGGDNPQLMWGLTHRDLPNSIFLEESWLGYPARVQLPNRQRTASWTKEMIAAANDRIIAGSGWGMRFLKAGGSKVMDTSFTFKRADIYRTDTEVITSVRVHTKSSSNRIDLFNPNHPGEVTFTINGKEWTHSVIMPDGGSQLAWVKWKTPATPGEVKISVKTSDGLYFEGESEEQEIIAYVVELNENTPPDPEAKDQSKDFGYRKVPVPNELEQKELTWGEYFATWHEYWVDRGKWETIWKKNPLTGKMEEDGEKWKPNWKDEGWWDWEFRTYKAKLSATLKVMPAEENPTGKALGDYEGHYEMKSGYGIMAELNTTVTTDAPSSDHYTLAGNAVAYFPEFCYKTYWRVFKKQNSGKFTFKKNEWSQWEAPVHFTPLWFPDGDYVLYTEIFDVWTPAGMLKINKPEYIKIRGNVYDDWHIGPVPYTED